MTAEWELALHKIEKNESDGKVFQKEMESYATTITNELLQIPMDKGNQPKIVCPKCKNQLLVIRDKIIKCPDETCKWLQFRNVCGVQITMDDIVRLVSKGRTSLIKGMKSKAGKSFGAYVVLNEDYTTSFEFENKKFKKS
ncbi:MAG TPA: topoisomerase C-terminal repeat-containing protein [Gelidibacter sp.]|nr:topoisomerase C-terminal repeat-containing protein [Gelidibacter sp.]